MTSTDSNRGSFSTTASTKAWSSGRVLTEEQRARKREANRISARRRKEQLKQRLEHLEAQVQAENQVGSVATPETSILKDEPAAQDDDQFFAPQDFSHVEESQNLLQHNNSGQQQRRASQSNAVIPAARADFNNPNSPNGKPYDAFVASCILLAVPLSPPVAARESQTSGVSESVSDFCVQLNKSTLTFSTNIVCSNDLENQNMLIQAVLNGWDTIDDLKTRCPLWTVLKYVDMALFHETPPIERLALLRNVHTMGLFQLHILSANDLPIWWRPRPVQLKFPHHPTIDYLPWPGMRERFILCDLKLTNDFWALFGRSFRLLWPYPTTACYTTIPGTNLLCFSDLFKEKTWDLNSWCMTPEWFETYPEMVDDINCAPTHTATIAQDLVGGSDVVAGYGIGVGFGCVQDLDFGGLKDSEGGGGGMTEYLNS